MRVLLQFWYLLPPRTDPKLLPFEKQTKIVTNSNLLFYTKETGAIFSISKKPAHSGGADIGVLGAESQQ